jgi:2-dehydropantoate 2-reductase
MRTLVIGAGATGGYFGGRNVALLVRTARTEQLKSNGPQIVSLHGDATVAPAVVTSEDVDRPAVSGGEHRLDGHIMPGR